MTHHNNMNENTSHVQFINDIDSKTAKFMKNLRGKKNI